MGVEDRGGDAGAFTPLAPIVSAETCGLGSLMYGTQNFDVHRPGGCRHKPHLRRHARRDLRATSAEMIRRLDPEARRVHPIHAHYPSVARPGCCRAPGLVDPPGLLRHNDHHLVHRVDEAGERGPGQVPCAAGGGLRGRSPALWDQPHEDHRPAHGALVHQPHYRDDVRWRYPR